MLFRQDTSFRKVNGDKIDRIDGIRLYLNHA